jgi:hypothetical protein
MLEALVIGSKPIGTITRWNGWQDAQPTPRRLNPSIAKAFVGPIFSMRSKAAGVYVAEFIDKNPSVEQLVDAVSVPGRFAQTFINNALLKTLAKASTQFSLFHL